MISGTWSAPGRVNLIGEHTDYNEGFALPMAIPQRTRVHARVRSDGLVTAVSSDRHREAVRFTVGTAPGDVASWGGYVAGVFWALREAGHAVPGVDLEIRSDVPVGAGLSSSAALCCAVAVALDGIAGLGLDRATLARLAQRAENDYVGVPTGSMDQLASMYGRVGHVILLDCRSLQVDAVRCDVRGAGLELLVIDTRAPHRLVDGEYGARRRTCEQAAARLGVRSLRDLQGDDPDVVLAGLDGDAVAQRRVRHVLTENGRVLDAVALLRVGRVGDIGPLLTASHASLRDDYEVTVPELDVAVAAALRAGALGARMTGGGFGGSIIALVEAGPMARHVVESIGRAYDEHRFTAPVAFTALPAAGAGLEEMS
ncbi:MAG: galactokinase [Jiangellaceae bacterium]